MKSINNLKKVFHLLFISTFLVACSSTDIVTFDSIKRTPTLVSDVEILLDKPTRPYKIIARIQFGPDAFISDYQRQTNEVIKRAAALGAEAVIVSYDSAVSGYTGGNTTTGVYGGTSESKYTVGQAIIYNNKK